MTQKTTHRDCRSPCHRPLLTGYVCLLLAIGLAASEFALALEVTDFAGRRVTLAKPAERIVALAPHSVENLYSAGAGHTLVGVVSYSNFPEAAKRLPIVGSYNAFSFEQIVALKPDLVLMWGSGNGMQTLTQLERLGIPVYVSELRRLADVPASIRRLGVLAGTEAVSHRKAEELEAALRDLRQAYSNQTTLSVFYQIWNEPLQTVNGEHLISEIITLCGGRNIFADSPALAPRISVESVLLANPDAIVASGMGVARPRWLDDWRRYPALAAVRNNGLLFIDPDHLQRPTARVFTGARALCEQLATLRGLHQAAAKASATR
ncbi:MAG: cobalamin-binding protein [Halioglobus sp.]